uniref:NADH-ubiquinone oxidoreductase chain 3 n=1 Tax=Haustorioides koreanus TaxID=2729224 RepID=A0A6M3RIY3_9CRUS|nr:NADH dehydrogenase subunit 3 [Haustorioides koreanus]
MAMFIVLFIISALIASLLLGLSLTLGERSMDEREKMSPFECGFDPFKKTRIPFSLRFFLITIIFLVFDVEIAVLLPLGLMKGCSDFYFISLSGLMLTIILVLGLVHEWNQGALNWIY